MKKRDKVGRSPYIGRINSTKVAGCCRSDLTFYISENCFINGILMCISKQ